MGHLYHGYVSHNQRVHPQCWNSRAKTGPNLLSIFVIWGPVRVDRPCGWQTKPPSCACIYIYMYIYIQNYIDTYPCARGCPNFDGEFRGLDDKPWNFWGLGEIQPSSGSAAAPPSRFSGHMGSPCGICGPNVAPRVKGWFRFTHSNAVIYAL